MLVRVQTYFCLLLLKPIFLEHLNNFLHEWYFVLTDDQAIVADNWNVVRGVPLVLTNLLGC